MVITSYHYAHIIARAIESVYAQACPYLEVLVVKNASTKHTDTIMQEYIHHPRVCYLRNAERWSVLLRPEPSARPHHRCRKGGR